MTRPITQRYVQVHHDKFADWNNGDIIRELEQQIHTGDTYIILLKHYYNKEYRIENKNNYDTRHLHYLPNFQSK